MFISKTISLKNFFDSIRCNLKGAQTLFFKVLLYRGKQGVIRKFFNIIDESKWYHNRSLFKYRLSILLEEYLQITEDRRKHQVELVR